MYLVNGKPMTSFSVKVESMRFGVFWTIQAALHALNCNGIPAREIRGTLDINGESYTVKQAIKLATLEADEDVIPRKFVTELAALKYLYNRGYTLA